MGQKSSDGRVEDPVAIIVASAAAAANREPPPPPQADAEHISRASERILPGTSAGVAWLLE